MTALTGWERETSPFHAGERALQELIGKRDRMEKSGRRVMRPFMPQQHRDFFNQLPFIAVGSVDKDGWPWASLLTGKPGFITSPDDRSLVLDAAPLSGDPLGGSLKSGAPLGFLGIELPTRRRNRVNGRVVSVDEGPLQIAVDLSFGNCPQYIQTRHDTFTREPDRTVPPAQPHRFSTLDEPIRALIRKADTFFVASYVDAGGGSAIDGVDVSHRGGRPGFVRVDGDTLTVPDFAGNNYFNTLGNFLQTPKAGLLFVDFETGDLVMLTGTVEIIHDAPDVAAFVGAQRAWSFTLDHGIRLPDAMPIRWTLDEFSPNSLISGTWAETEATLAAEAKRETWRPYRVTKIQNESSTIRSFYLKPDDGGGLPPYGAGQYLTIRATPDDADNPVTRTYTLSSEPADNQYRISVKREDNGWISHHLHQELKPGAVIEAKAPRGEFRIDASVERPAVLIAGGVGITPMISMARHVATEALRTRHYRPLTVFHAARATAQRAFHEAFCSLANESGGKMRYISLISRPEEQDEKGVDYDLVGRIGPEILRDHLALDDYDFYLCGPGGFMQSVYDGIRALGVRDARIHAEAFGPASLVRRSDADAVPPIEQKPEAEVATVTFTKSGFEHSWTPEDGTLLEFAEAHGLSPEHGCRSGACGACAVPMLSGTETYRNAVTASCGDGEILICSAVPAEGADSMVLDL